MQQNTALLKLRKELLNIAEGELRTVLETFDPAKEMVKTVPEFIDYLIKLGPVHKYNQDNVYNLMVAHASNSELQRFIYRMAKASRGSLRNALLSLNIEELGLKSAEEIVQYLINVSAQNGYSEQDVINALLQSCNELLDEMLFRIHYMDNLTHRGWLSRSGPAFITSGILLFLFLLLILSLRRTKRRTRS